MFNPANLLNPAKLLNPGQLIKDVTNPGKMLQNLVDPLGIFNPGQLVDNFANPTKLLGGLLDLTKLPQAFLEQNPFARPLLNQNFFWFDPSQILEGLQDLLKPEPTPAPENPGLEVNGNVIDAGRYEVHVQRGEVKILDTETGDWVRAWGDPHLHTSDGDKAQFHTDNVTIDLPDGTKVTITPTEKDANGIALVDTVSVMKGDQAVMAVNISTAPVMGTVANNAAAVDAAHEDGTVLQVGGELDDLFFAANGLELLGTDPTQRWSEHLLDGIGGESKYDFTATGAEDLANDAEATLDSADDAGGIDFPSTRGMDIMTRIMMIMSRVGKQTQDMMDRLEQLQGKREARDRKQAELDNFIRGGGTVEDAKFGELSEELKAFGDLDTAFENLNTQVQAMVQLKQQLSQMLTNLMKSDHDAKMATVRNMRA